MPDSAGMVIQQGDPMALRVIRNSPDFPGVNIQADSEFIKRMMSAVEAMREDLKASRVSKNGFQSLMIFDSTFEKLKKSSEFAPHLGSVVVVPYEQHSAARSTISILPDGDPYSGFLLVKAEDSLIKTLIAECTAMKHENYRSGPTDPKGMSEFVVSEAAFEEMKRRNPHIALRLDEVEITTLATQKAPIAPAKTPTSHEEFKTALIGEGVEAQALNARAGDCEAAMKKSILGGISEQHIPASYQSPYDAEFKSTATLTTEFVQQIRDDFAGRITSQITYHSDIRQSGKAGNHFTIEFSPTGSNAETGALAAEAVAARLSESGITSKIKGNSISFEVPANGEAHQGMKGLVEARSHLEAARTAFFNSADGKTGLAGFLRNSDAHSATEVSPGRAVVSNIGKASLAVGMVTAANDFVNGDYVGAGGNTLAASMGLAAEVFKSGPLGVAAGAVIAGTEGVKTYNKTGDIGQATEATVTSGVGVAKVGLSLAVAPVLAETATAVYTGYTGLATGAALALEGTVAATTATVTGGVLLAASGGCAAGTLINKTTGFSEKVAESQTSGLTQMVQESGNTIGKKVKDEESGLPMISLSQNKELARVACRNPEEAAKLSSDPLLAARGVKNFQDPAYIEKQFAESEKDLAKTDHRNFLQKWVGMEDGSKTVALADHQSAQAQMSSYKSEFNKWKVEHAVAQHNDPNYQPKTQDNAQVKPGNVPMAQNLIAGATVTPR